MMLKHPPPPLLLFFILLLFMASSFNVGMAGAGGGGGRKLAGDSPFTAKASLIRYWKKQVSSDLPKPWFLLNKASPLDAVQLATFSKLADQNSLSTQLPAFCSKANLLCFPDLSASLEKHSKDVNFASYLLQNFTNYGNDRTGGVDSFKNYSNGDNIPVDTFRRYSRDSVGHDDKFTNYALDANVVDQSFNTYGTAATGGTGQFKNYNDESNIPGLKFTSYSDSSNGRKQGFKGYATDSNTVTHPTMEVQSSWSNLLKKQPPPPPSPNHLSATSNAVSLPQAAEGMAVGSCNSTKGIAVAVVDANAIIQGGQSLAPCADRFVSVSEVLNEIRDPTSRHSLNFLPFSVDTLEPSPDALKKVIHFARATGDLQTLSDVDLKLIALTYTLEAQIHGTQHLRDSPPPIHTVNVKRLPEKDMPGWGSNVPNLEEWEALDLTAEDESNSNSKILPLKDLNLNIISKEQHGIEDNLTGNSGEGHTDIQEHANGDLRQNKKYSSKKIEVKLEGKKMVADGIDATQGEFNDNAEDWLPAVSRSTRRRYLRRKSRREMHEALSEKVDKEDTSNNMEDENLDDTRCPDLLVLQGSAEVPHGKLEENVISEMNNGHEDVSAILHQLQLQEESCDAFHDDKELKVPSGRLDSNDLVTTCDNSETVADGGEAIEINNGIENLDMTSLDSETVGASHMDDNSSEQSWMLRSLSESSVACVTGDYAMQNVLLQMGLRLVAPGGMQIRELHRWVLKCHACYKVTTDIGRVFCPNCGNGGTLRKVAVTVGENGIILAARRPRISVRGTRFSLPLPQGGRDAITKNPILREDQLPQKFLYPKTKKKNKQGDDIFSSDDIFTHHMDKRAPLQPPVRKALAVFSGKRNPNDNHYSRAKH